MLFVLHVLKGLLLNFVEACSALAAMACHSEDYPQTVFEGGSGQQPDETLRAALQAALPKYAIGRAIGTGGISTCFEAFAGGQPRAIKVSHKGVSPRGSNHLVAVLAEVRSTTASSTRGCRSHAKQ